MYALANTLLPTSSYIQFFMSTSSPFISEDMWNPHLSEIQTANIFSFSSDHVSHKYIYSKCYKLLFRVWSLLGAYEINHNIK